MSSDDCVTVSTVVEVDPASAFRVFTEEIDVWWRRDPRYRAPDDRRLCFEPGASGRLVAYEESGQVFEIGRIRVWEPAVRLVFDWRARDFAADEVTVVEVRFEGVAQGTRVTVEHRGWDAFPADHPVRHHLEGEAFRHMFGVWWGDLLIALRSCVENPR